MLKNRKLIIIGDSAFAEVAYECFMHDSDYEVIGFTVESKYLKKDFLFGLPIVPFENLQKYYSPDDVDFYCAIIYTQLNRLRTRLYLEAKSKRYRPASYVSSRAFVWHNVKIGEHCFIFEDNTVQPFVEIKNNVVLWSGNHIGHHSVIQDNCFISSHAVISGFCSVGKNCFIGVNASIANNTSIGDDNLIGAGVTISCNTPPDSLFKDAQIKPSNVSARRFFKIRDNVL
jgi:sugar O-acyltransferase (sialic acid O-acetyltransferase NeuD family)